MPVVSVIDSSSAPVTLEECSQVVEKCLHSTNFKISEATLEPSSESPAGFLAQHLRLRIVASQNNLQSLKMQFFVKAVPNNTNTDSNFVEESGAFRKEADLLTSVLHKLKLVDLVKTADVGSDGMQDISIGSSWTCKCYLANRDVIILEDLSAYNFELFERRIPLDGPHCQVVLETLATFHAGSFIWEEMQTNQSGNDFRILDCYRDLFFEPIDVDVEGHPGWGIFMAGVMAVQAVSELMQKYGPQSEQHDVIRQRLLPACKRIPELLSPSRQYRNVVCHGDLWVNNILFRYEGGLPTECRFVDFQLVRYVPPACDIMSFLHLTTARAFREANLERLLDVYYARLSAELRAHGLVVEKLLPRSELDASCRQYREVGAIFAPLYFSSNMLPDSTLTPIVTDPERFRKFFVQSRHKEAVANFLGDAIYRQRMYESVEELIERCVLQGH